MDILENLFLFPNREYSLVANLKIIGISPLYEFHKKTCLFEIAGNLFLCE